MESNVDTKQSSIQASLVKWKEPLGFVREHKAAFVVFMLASGVVGLIGVWLPLVLPIFRPDLCLTTEFRKLLWDGSLYLFSIPFLTAMLGNVFASLVEDTDQAIRELKIVSISSVTLGVFLALVFLCVHLAARLPSAPVPAFGIKDLIQLLLFTMSLLAGIYLYCLPNFGRTGFQYAKVEDSKVKRVVESAHQVTSDDGVNVAGKENG